VEVGVPRGQKQRRVADHQHGLVRQVRQPVEIGRLRSGLGEVGPYLPDLATQELQQADRRSRRSREQYGPIIQLADGPPADSATTTYGTVA